MDILYMLLLILMSLVCISTSHPLDNLLHEAAPMNDHTTAKASPRSPLKGRVIYAVVSLLSLCTVSAMLSSRLKILFNAKFKKMNLIRWLCQAIYILAICFILTTGVVMDGWDLSTEELCRAGIIICLIFYVGGKVIMYLFLVERVHLIRSQPRAKDLVFLIGTFVILCGFGVIAVFAFMDPVTAISTIDGQCRIGLPLIVTLPLLVYDIAINTALTGVFFVLVKNSYAKGLTLMEAGRLSLKAIPFRNKSIFLRSQSGLLKLMIAKSVLGAMAVVIPTIANLTILFKLKGHEQAWLCFTICTIDVTWGVTIMHWLTNNPGIDYNDAPTALHDPRHSVVGEIVGEEGSYIEMN